MIINRINGVWRKTEINLCKVNGVWRTNNDVYTNINGVWRSNIQKPYKPEDIIGFHIVYRLNKRIYNDKYPNLRYNPNIPVYVGLGGKDYNEMNLNHKSVVFEYMRQESSEEGMVFYEGRIYAEMSDSSIVEISNLISDIDGYRELTPNGRPCISDYWKLNRIVNMDIAISGYTLFQSYGYYLLGWNAMFSNEHFLDQNTLSNSQSIDRKLYTDHYIYPTKKRSKEYNHISTIGIIRDMKNPNSNMVGSHGTLDHTYYQITVNGRKMPFRIDLYKE